MSRALRRMMKRNGVHMDTPIKTFNNYLADKYDGLIKSILNDEVALKLQDYPGIEKMPLEEISKMAMELQEEQNRKAAADPDNIYKMAKWYTEPKKDYLYVHWEKSNVDLPELPFEELAALGKKFYDSGHYRDSIFYNYVMLYRVERYKADNLKRTYSRFEIRMIIVILMLKKSIKETRQFWDREDGFLKPKYKTSLTKALNLVESFLDEIELCHLDEADAKKVKNEINDYSTMYNSNAKKHQECVDSHDLVKFLPKDFVIFTSELNATLWFLKEKYSKSLEKFNVKKIVQAGNHIKTYMDMVEKEIIR